MFVVDFGLRLENHLITSAYNGTTHADEDAASFIKDGGARFEASDWLVRLPASKRTSEFAQHTSTVITFMDDDLRRYRRCIPSECNGTLLLGHDDVSGKLKTYFLQDDAASELCERFGITTIRNEDPNTVFTGNWVGPNYDGDWDITTVISDGNCVQSVPSDELLGYRGPLRFMIGNATWAIVCHKAYQDGHRSCSYELYTNRSAHEMLQILEDYTAQRDFTSLGEVFYEWELD